MKRILSYWNSIVVSNKQGINNVSIQGGYYKMNQNEANRNMKEDKSIVLVDVRTPQEYAELHIPGSILIPLDTLKTEAEKKLMDKKAIIYLYCRSGNRSASAAKTLVELGYSKVYNIGGISSWPFETEKGGSK
jgi:phage shock protein E